MLVNQIDPIYQSIQLTIAAIITVMALSILVKESPIYRFIEFAMVGAASAHWIIAGLVSMHGSIVGRIEGGDFLWIPGFLLAFLFYAKYVRQYNWLPRYPMAILGGTGIGLSIRGMMTTEIHSQIRASIYALGATPETFQNLLILVSLVLPIWYFVFTYGEPKGTVGAINKHLLSAARVFIMLNLGIKFGQVVVSRYILILGRFIFILSDWLGLVAAA